MSGHSVENRVQGAVERMAARGPRRYVVLETEEREANFNAPLHFILENDPGSESLDGRYKIVAWETNAPFARLGAARLNLDAHVDHVAVLWAAVKQERHGRGGVVPFDEREILRDAALRLADEMGRYAEAVERERYISPEEAYERRQEAKGRIFGVWRAVCWCYDREQERAIADEYMVTGGLTYSEAEAEAARRRGEATVESEAREGRIYWRVRAMPAAREEGASDG